jgi:hypothetical protein
MKERSSLWVLDGHDDRLLEQPLGLLQPRHVLPLDVRMPDDNVLRDQGRHLLDLDAAKVGGRLQSASVALPIGVLRRNGNASVESEKPDSQLLEFSEQGARRSWFDLGQGGTTTGARRKGLEYHGMVLQLLSSLQRANL